MSTVIVFDVNETLLDLAPVRAWFRDRFGDGIDARSWFSELLRVSFVSSVTDRYSPFTELAGHALETVAVRNGIGVDLDDLTAIRGILATLPPHPDVEAGLGTLSKSGFELAALTNSPLSTAHAQLEHAGISGYFASIMSVEMVKRFKPHRSVYLAAARSLDRDPTDLVMVAAHDWDIAGAAAAGLDTVFISRPGQLYSPAFPEPTLTAPDIATAAASIIVQMPESRIQTPESESGL